MMLAEFLKFYRSQDKIIFYSVVFSLFSSLVVLIFFALEYKNLPARVPLFYSLPWGGAQLVNRPQFIILPSLAVLICLINLITSWHLHPSQLILKRTLSLASALVAALILITAFKIILIFI